jgi:hypothetical protein
MVPQGVPELQWATAGPIPEKWLKALNKYVIRGIYHTWKMYYHIWANEIR